jgi:hypothetical protein
MKMYRHLESMQEFEKFQASLSLIFQIEKKFPDKMFNAEYGRFRMSDHPDGQDDQFEIALPALLKVARANALFFGTTNPKVVNWFLDSFGVYPVVELFSGATYEDYLDAIAGPGGRQDPASAEVRTNSYQYTDRLFWLTDNHMIAMYSEMIAETFVLAFHQDLDLSQLGSARFFFSVEEFTADILYPGMPAGSDGFNRKLSENYCTDDR